MRKISPIARQAVEHIDRYLAGTESAADLGAWALAQPLFANPKALDNREDWILGNALALMAAVTEDPTKKSRLEQELHEAREFLTGERSFPEESWPTGLVGRKV
jgi:hypothetical protein